MAAILNAETWRAWDGWNIVPAKWRGPLAFSLRSWLASVLALFVAFYLQLDSPFWAAMAVWMVAQPTPGMAISKGFYRIVGTLIGSTMGVVLIALFAQTPELFIAALGVWTAVTTVISNLLRNFMAYGAVLAGYTAAIVSLGVFDNPNQIFTIAMARGSATIIGIACSMLVTALFARHDTRRRTMVRLQEVIALAGRRAAFPAEAALREKVKLGMPMTMELIALDAEIGFASAESATFRIHADGARSLLAHLFGAYAAKRSLDARRVRAATPLDPRLAKLLEETAVIANQGGNYLREGREEAWEKELERLRKEGHKLKPELSPSAIEIVVTERILLDRLDDILRHLIGALQDWRGLQGGWVPTNSLSLNFHRDHRMAMINGVRAFIAIAAAGAFWIATAWSSGASMLTLVAVACSLFSAAPRPDAAGMAFFWGSLVAIPSGFLCDFYLLQNVTGFPLFALVIGLFIIPMAMFFTNPKTTLLTLGMCVNFFSIAHPLNQMDYNVVTFLNGAVAAVLGTLFGVLAYQLFLPPNPPAARRYVVHRIGRGLELLAFRKPIPQPWEWQTRMADRVNRLHDPANLSGTSTDEWFEGGLETLNLGNELLRLRLLLRDGPLTPALAELGRTVVAAFTRLKSDPSAVERTIRSVRERLPFAPQEPEERLAWVRLRGIFEEMEAFFATHPNFLTP